MEIGFKIANWNIGGAKYLEVSPAEREGVRNKINDGISQLITSYEPQVITFQEVVRYGESEEKANDIIDIDKLSALKFNYYFYQMINTIDVSNQDKWDKVKAIKENGQGRWPPDYFFAQGNAYAIKKDLANFPIWDLTADCCREDRDVGPHLIEKVALDSGLYFGDRDTEPMAALVAHFILNPNKDTKYAFRWNESSGNENAKLREFLTQKFDIDWLKTAEILKKEDNKTIKIFNEKNSLLLKLNDKQTEVILEIDDGRTNKLIAKTENDELNIYDTIKTKPLDIFVINTHLTTIMMEREGIPQKDNEATRIRLGQIEVIFHGIISRYNLWKQQKFPKRGEKRKLNDGETSDRYQPVWVIAGDFNFTEKSLEYETIQRMNFIDVVGFKGAGSKASGAGNDPSLTVDYIFAGPKFNALDPFITERGIIGNKVIHEIKSSDHYPMIANIPIYIPDKK